MMCRGQVQGRTSSEWLGCSAFHFNRRRSMATDNNGAVYEAESRVYKSACPGSNLIEMRPPAAGSTQDAGFESKVWKALLHFRRANAVFFHKRVTSTMVTALIDGPFAYSLEFPAKFIDAYSKSIKPKCTFERPNLDRKWPITITVRNVKVAGMKNRVFAYGKDGWLVFLMDNRIAVGDALFVRLVEMSRFEVHIIRTPIEEQPANLLRQFNPVNLQPRRTNARHGKAREVTENPCFVATVQMESVEVPGRFWERYREILHCDGLHLQGPKSLNLMLVQAKRTYICGEEVVLTVRLEKGWTEFVIANRLQVGSYVQFTLVSLSRFQVKVLNCF